METPDEEKNNLMPKAEYLSTNAERREDEASFQAQNLATLKRFDITRISSYGAPVSTTASEDGTDDYYSAENDELEQQLMRLHCLPGTQNENQEVDGRSSLPLPRTEEVPENVNKVVVSQGVTIRRRKRKAFEMLQEETSDILDGWEHYDKVMTYTSPRDASKSTREFGVNTGAIEKRKPSTGTSSKLPEAVVATQKRFNGARDVASPRRATRLEVVLRSSPSNGLDQESVNATPEASSSALHQSSSASGFVKRRRGRPRKVQSVTGPMARNEFNLDPEGCQIKGHESTANPADTSFEPAVQTTTVPVVAGRGRPRGRPRKRGRVSRAHAIAAPRTTSTALPALKPGQIPEVDGITALTRRRGPGRPRKRGSRGVQRARPTQGQVQSVISHSLRG